MDYHIETAEVIDAFKEDTECPFCAIREKLDISLRDTYLGGAAMSPEFRTEVNKLGFCAEHFKLLYDGGKRLPLALQLHTHMLEHNERMAGRLDSLAKSALKGKKFSAGLNEFLNFQNETERSCVICKKAQASLERYMEVALRLWEQSIEFKELFRNGKGLCEPHFAELVKCADKHMSVKLKGMFINELVETQKRNMDRLAGEVLWFTKKFDYQNKDKPWGNSQDSVPRSINKLKGKII